ncbi:MAG: hypothetical protein AAF632_18725 [Bacteroidota bacterium]
MSRKRILLCLSEPIGDDSVARFVTRYFHDDHRLIPVYLPAKKLVAEELLEVEGVPANHFRHSNGKSLNGSSESYWATCEAAYNKIYSEARFSDLLIIKEKDYHRFFHEKNDQSVLSLLASPIPCPKLIVPSQEESIEQIILIDDGRPATHNQIKCLCCMFAELCLTIPTVLLITQGKNNYLSSQEQRLWIDYLKVHFAHLAVHRFEEQMVATLMFAFDISRNALLMGPYENSATLLDALAPLNQFRLLQ